MHNILFLFFCCSLTTAQNIRGKVTEIDGEPISMVLIQLLDKDQIMLDYQYTKEDGSFLFENNVKSGKVKALFINSLFYQEQRILYTGQKFFSITMTESTEKLDKIVVKAQIESQDTVGLDLSSRNIDRIDKVEDALKKIPGIKVEKNGKIYYLNKEIEKILIDGDDLAGDQYTFISRNLRAEVLQEIEVLKNYEENTVLKNIKNSNKIALNLRLKDAYKNIWFGNAEATHGNDFKNDQDFKIINTTSLLSSKFKFLGAARYSSLGDRAIGELLNEEGDRSSIMDQVFLYNQVDVTAPLPEMVINFNKAASATFLLNKKVGSYNIKSTNYVGRDDLDQFYTTSTIFPFQDQDILNQNFISNKDILKFQGDITLRSKDDASKYLESVLVYDVTSDNGFSNLSAGDQFIGDDLRTQSFKARNSNKITQLIYKNLILDTHATVEYSHGNENVQIQSNDFLFPNQLNKNNINQEIKRNTFLVDVGSRSRIPLTDNSVLNAGVSWSYSIDHLINESAPLNNPLNFNEKFNRFELKIPVTYVYNIKKTTSLITEFTPRYSVINNENFNLFDFGVRLEKTIKGRWALKYSRINTIPLNEQLISGTFLSGSNTLRRSGLPIESIKEDVFSLSHAMRNHSNSIENEISLTWNLAQSVPLTTVELQDNFSIIDLDLVQRNQKNFSFREQLVWLFGSYGLNLTAEYNIIKTPVSAATDLVSKILMGSYSLSANSYFSSGLNFAVQAQYNNSIQFIDNNKNGLENFLLNTELSYELSKTLDIKLLSNTSFVNQTIYNVLNLEVNYLPKKSSYSLSSGIFNLLNEDQFITQQRETFFFSTTRLPLRSILPYLKLSYTF